MKIRHIGLAAGLGVLACAAQAPSSVTLDGTLDPYLSRRTSRSGASVTALEDGTKLRSRVGLRGEEDLGGGIKAKFQLESGFAADTGASAETTRLFDRQAWVGFGTRYGKVRLGRQNGVVFGAGNGVDFTARTLGFGESAGSLRA